MNNSAALVMLATLDEDVTLCSLEQAGDMGTVLATLRNSPVTARDPISDEVIATYEPLTDDDYAVWTQGHTNRLWLAGTMPRWLSEGAV